MSGWANKAAKRHVERLGDDGGLLTWQSSPHVLFWLHRLQKAAT